MRIGIDIDDTITDTRSRQLIYWKKYFNENPKDGYTEELPEKINDFGDEYIDRFWDEYRSLMNENPIFIKDSIDTINKLHDLGFEIHIVTARRKEHHPNLEKLFIDNNILIDKLSTDIMEKGIHCKENNISLLIDDNYTNCVNALNSNIDVICFGNNYKEFNCLYNWNDVYNYIINKYYEVE